MTMTPRKVELVVRPAEERDVPAIQKIAREAWDETYAEIVGRVEREEILDHLCSRRSLLEDIGRHDSFFFVATLDDGVVGFAELVAEGKAGEVARIAVRPDWQRRGVATRLLRRGLAALAAGGAGEVTAGIEIQDVACRQLFERNGFRAAEAPVAELEEYDDLELAQYRRTLEDAAPLEAAAEATVWVDDGRRACPRCHRRFDGGVEVCPDCEVTLVAEPPRERRAAPGEPGPRFVTILATADESRLSFAESALEGADIVYTVRSGTAGNGTEERIVELRVAASRAEEAREVLDALEEEEVAVGAEGD